MNKTEETDYSDYKIAYKIAKGLHMRIYITVFEINGILKMSSSISTDIENAVHNTIQFNRSHINNILSIDEREVL